MKNERRAYQARQFASRDTLETLRKFEEALTAHSLSQPQILLLKYVYLVAVWRLDFLLSLESGKVVETDILQEVNRPEFDFLDDYKEILNFWVRGKDENGLQEIKDRAANRIKAPSGPCSS